MVIRIGNGGYLASVSGRKLEYKEGCTILEL